MKDFRGEIGGLGRESCQGPKLTESYIGGKSGVGPQETEKHVEARHVPRRKTDGVRS